MSVVNLPQVEGAENGLIADNFFTDPAWHQFSFQLGKEIGAYPNRLFHNADTKCGAIVAFRGNSDSWAVNEAAINYLSDAVRDGRIDKGFVILATRPKTVVSVMEIEEVKKLLKGMTPRDGDFGRYWWLDDPANALF
jgi:hypothetical protein